MAHWKLDETDGDIAFDSVSGEDALVIGDPFWQPISGIVDGDLEFDGTDYFVNTDFVLNPADGPLSVFAWVQDGAPGQTVISQFNGANWLATDSALRCLTTELCSSGRGGIPLLSAANITDGSWHRIGFVWDGAYRVLYVDDAPVAENTQRDLEGCVDGLNIGGGTDSAAGTYWSGMIDNVRIYNRAVNP